MGGQARIAASLLVLACASSGVWADRKFNINDDLLAYPQFQINFPDGFVLDSQARAFLDQIPHGRSTAGKRDAYEQAPLKDESHDAMRHETGDEVQLSYEEMILGDQRYLCQIPVVKTSEENRTKVIPLDEEEERKEEERKELKRATNRGLELLRDMEDRCLYYLSGWWSYSFCYMNKIKQFHALPAGGGVPSYPPMEDPTTHSFILGRFPREDDQGDDEVDTKPGKVTTADLAELQTKGGSRYLVQHLEDGDQCDLTGQNRKIEVHFHCNPQSTDRIAWIKELHTCSYLMLIYTPRLCNDVAFLPPQQEEVHTIECREILRPEEVSDWQAMHEYQAQQELVESAETSDYPVIGGVKVGAQLYVGTEGRRIEKGRITSIGEKKVDVVAKITNGEVHLLAPENLKKFDLDAEKLESLKKKMEDWAEGKDWNLEMVTGNGERAYLRGRLDEEEEEEEETERVRKDKKEQNKGALEKPADHQDEKVLDKEQKADVRESEEPALEAEDSEGSKEVFKDEL
ncbi:protein OS-9 [Aspergillus californicus]